MTEQTDIATVQNDVKWLKSTVEKSIKWAITIPLLFMVSIAGIIYAAGGHVAELNAHKAIDTIMHKQLDAEILELKGTLRDVVEIKILEQLGDVDAAKKLEDMRKEWEPPPPIYAGLGGEEA